MVETDARGEMGTTMEGMVGEKRILPERSEWFRSRQAMSPLAAILGLCKVTTHRGCVRQHHACSVHVTLTPARFWNPHRCDDFSITAGKRRREGQTPGPQASCHSCADAGLCPRLPAPWVPGAPGYRYRAHST